MAKNQNQFLFVDVSDKNLSTWDIHGKFVSQHDQALYQEKTEAYDRICTQLPNSGACTVAALLDDGSILQSVSTYRDLHAEENLIMEYRAKLPPAKQSGPIELCVHGLYVAIEPCHAKYYRKANRNPDCIELFGTKPATITSGDTTVRARFVPGLATTYVFFLQPQMTPADISKKKAGMPVSRPDDFKRAKNNDAGEFRFAMANQISVPEGTSLQPLGRNNKGKPPIIVGKPTMPKDEVKRKDKVYVKPTPNL